MDDDPLHEQIASYEQLSEDVRELNSEREDIADDVANRLAETLADAVSEVGTNVGAVERSDDGHHYRFEARLDRAALVAAVTEELADGFVVSHVNDDGTLSIEWTGERATPSGREHGAILKAIVAEEMDLDSDGLIEAVPTRKRVLARAVELGIEEGDAADRLARLETLDVVDLSDGKVYPDENFSRY